MIVLVDYASPSVFETTRDSNLVGIAANARRPVRFHGTVVEHSFLLQIALRTLGEAIWSDDTWTAQSDLLDPVFTVHPDRIFCEAFSQDQSVYASLIIDPDIFETHGDVVTGTTNIDFTAWLWGALGEMRGSRETTFRVGAEGFEAETTGVGGRFEKKVDLPDSWVRGFLQTQAAMAMPGTRFPVQPVDLLSAIRFLRYTKDRVSPRALRYEFEPGQDVQLVLEPWEHIVPLHGALHNDTQAKKTRVWGRRRLSLIEGLLPFADSVEVFLKGRALPSFYAVKMPGITFVLGLTGQSGQAFTGTGGFDLLQEASSADDEITNRVLEQLREQFHCSIEDISRQADVERTTVSRALVRLCRQGRCMYDVETRRYRHRELFENVAAESVYDPPDRRQELATSFLDAGIVTVEACHAEETKKQVRMKSPDGRQHREVTLRDWRVTGAVSDIDQVEVVVNDTGRIIFGGCGCDFFREHLLNQGPCEHILALYRASESQRTDQASSRAVQEEDSSSQQPSRWEVEYQESVDDDEGEQDA